MPASREIKKSRRNRSPRSLMRALACSSFQRTAAAYYVRRNPPRGKRTCPPPTWSRGCSAPLLWLRLITVSTPPPSFEFKAHCGLPRAHHRYLPAWRLRNGIARIGIAETRPESPRAARWIGAHSARANQESPFRNVPPHGIPRHGPRILIRIRFCLSSWQEFERILPGSAVRKRATALQRRVTPASKGALKIEKGGFYKGWYSC